MKKTWLAGVLLTVLAVTCGTFAKGVDKTLLQAPETGRNTSAIQRIEGLTEQNNVVAYLRQNNKLPDIYITKMQARDLGWNAKQGNLCQVLPGRAIGGDKFTNREKKLPMKPKRQWFEADVNYRCGHRGSDRLLYSSDGLIYLTLDHYRSFTLME
ncbi:barnase [Photorhabdus luminescens]|uniref:Ribonuclease n=1 Tax=Photorhabdus luminescens subsp. mexicana TaxID=2100167 RepID=A0A4R4JNR5_PHOLU|nr:ribonuclease domain-containing protein [Photorhabdus luminescens]MCW7761765.1 barnase [Photorhabdus luminescens subsp. venezuelensis]OWO81299.1 barnase [Photorhabdus luminescens]TDB56008.1 barnase [Photorhabdus luminescens subsp. mexicana]